MVRMRIAFMVVALVSMPLSATAQQSEEGKVSGSVTVSGKALTEGRVFFHLADGQFVGCRVKDGKYTLERVPQGTWKVTVEGDGVPAKQKSDTTTDLTAKVKEGDNTFDFDFSLER